MELRGVWLLFIPIVTSCQSTPSTATPEVFESSSKLMAPHFECANYFSLKKNDQEITAALDRAATIGEDNGLSHSQIMSSYKTTKTAQEYRVLNRATSIAAYRDDRKLPRISGAPYDPESQDEEQAWSELYEEQCTRP